MEDATTASCTIINNKTETFMRTFLVAAGAMLALAIPSANAFTDLGGFTVPDKSTEPASAAADVSVDFTNIYVSEQGRAYVVSATFTIAEGKTFDAPVYCVLSEGENGKVIDMHSSPQEVKLPTTDGALTTERMDWYFRSNDGWEAYDADKEVWVSMCYTDSDGNITILGEKQIAGLTPTAIDGVEADGSEATMEYYTFEGVKVAHPRHGAAYIERCGAKARKIVY